MEILWDADKPLTSLEITEQMGSAMCVGNLHRVLQKLEKKGYITMCGAERNGLQNISSGNLSRPFRGRIMLPL